MDLFVRLDRFILEQVFERFAHWFQRLTGKTNFWLAKLSRYVLVLSTVVDIVLRSMRDNVLDVAILVFFSVVFIPRFGMIIREMESRPLRGVRNDAAISPIWMCARMLAVLFLASSQIILVADMVYGVPFSRHVGEYWLRQIEFLSYDCLFYFIACTPLPPGNSALKQWAEGFSQKWESLWRPTGQPA